MPNQTHSPECATNRKCAALHTADYDGACYPCDCDCQSKSQVRRIEVMTEERNAVADAWYKTGYQAGRAETIKELTSVVVFEFGGIEHLETAEAVNGILTKLVKMDKIVQ